MKRLHVHVSVHNLADSIRFYSTMFASEPTVVKPDYAKWMLDDPRVNFAISQRGAAIGLNHLGIQAESSDELAEVHERLKGLKDDVIEETGAACCYAKSDKYWVTDPQGIAWESFHTLASIPVFSNHKGAKDACCVPLASPASQKATQTDTACCVPMRDGASGACCG